MYDDRSFYGYIERVYPELNWLLMDACPSDASWYYFKEGEEYKERTKLYKDFRDYCDNHFSPYLSAYDKLDLKAFLIEFLNLDLDYLYEGKEYV